MGTTLMIAGGIAAALYLLVGWMITTDHSQPPRLHDVRERMKRL